MRARLESDKKISRERRERSRVAARLRRAASATFRVPHCCLEHAELPDAHDLLPTDAAQNPHTDNPYTYFIGQTLYGTAGPPCATVSGLAEAGVAITGGFTSGGEVGHPVPVPRAAPVVREPSGIDL